MSGVLVPGERSARRLTWSMTWLAYATYYVGRKGLGVVKLPLQRELGLSVAALGLLDIAFLAVYSAGQFLSGFFGDRWGARRLVGFGMLLSALACAAFGCVSGLAAMLVCMLLNGLAQSTGWPGTTRAMAEWTTPAERGTVMGYWSTCYTVGGIAATWLAGEVAQRYGWRAAFFVAALCLLAVGLLVLGLLPSRTAAAPASEPAPHASAAASPEVERERLRSERVAAAWRVVKSPRIWLYGTSYFFIKLIRYALLFWLPYYLAQRFGYRTDESARFSTAFDAGGIAGVILLGMLSDRFPARGRSVWALFSIAALALALLAYVAFGESSRLYNVLLLALIGALLFGPDALISGAAAQDAGGPLAPALAAGFVNGLGSLGALLQGVLVPFVHARFGFAALFPVFVGCAFCAGLALLPTLRAPAEAGPH